MKAVQHRIAGKAILPWKPQSIYHNSCHLVAWYRYHWPEASLTRLQATVDKSSDSNLCGCNQKQFKGRHSTSLSRLTIVSLRQCKESNTLQNVSHKMCRPQNVSTRSLGHYAWGCLCDILSPKESWGYGVILEISICVKQKAKKMAPKKYQLEKRILRTHITVTAQNSVSQ